MTDNVMAEMDEHLSREDRVLARLRRRAEDYARNPPETQPSMFPVMSMGCAPAWRCWLPAAFLQSSFCERIRGQRGSGARTSVRVKGRA
jgi:hypothetical protein